MSLFVINFCCFVVLCTTVYIIITIYYHFFRYIALIFYPSLYLVFTNHMQLLLCKPFTTLNGILSAYVPLRNY